MTDRLQAFRIAILDDTPSTLKLVSRMFEHKLTCETFTYQTGEALLADQSENIPDLYLLDIKMPGKDGVEVCQELKAKAETKNIPIIFFSARGDPDTRLRGLSAGAIDFVDKPFFPEELLLRVKGQITLHRSHIKMRQQLEEKKALLRVLCHDLKNPVGAAYSSIQLMREIEEIDSPNAQLAMEACQSALDLIDHISEFHAINDQATNLRTQKVNIREAFDESIRINQAAADAKQVHLGSEVEDGLTLEINRVVLIHNLLNNLINNAIKFSHPEGSIQLTGRTVNHAGRAHCQIEVIDKGIGIPPAKREHLFDPVENRSTNGTAGELGAGMGLPLVKRFTERYGGTITVVSETEQVPTGTTISLLFPLPAEGASLELED